MTLSVNQTTSGPGVSRGRGECGLCRARRPLHSLVLMVSICWLLPLATCIPKAAAQPQPEHKPADTTPKDAPKAAEKKDEKKDKKEEKKDRWFAVKGATVHTISGPTLEQATIVCKNGKVYAIGRSVPIPHDAEQLDATGFHVYPGLIAVRSVTLVGGEPPEDTTDVFSLASTAALASGLTTVVTGNTAAKVTYGTLEGMIVKRNLFETMRYRSTDPGGKRRMREGFEKARQYLRDQQAFEEDRKRNPDLKAPDDKNVKSGDAALALRLLKGEATALVDADTAGELLQLCDLVEEYGFKMVIRGAREGWTVAPRLARAGIACIITPRSRVDPDPRMLRPNGGTIENAAILHDHGVQIAVIPSIPGIGFGGLGGRDLMQLNLEAAFAVRGGLSEETALRAITLDAARILGVDDRVGSIQVGKDADFFVADGDALYYMTMSRWTIVNGRIMYDKNKETLLNHIRPDGNINPPPPNDVWPKRLGSD